jgi:hypothetical protein
MASRASSPPVECPIKWMGPSSLLATAASVSSTRAARQRIEDMGKVGTSVTVTGKPILAKLLSIASRTPLK